MPLNSLECPVSERSSVVTEFITARLDETAHDAMRRRRFRDVKTIDAMRKLLDAHLGYYGPGDDEHFPIPTLRVLAAIWDDHDDYPDVLPD